MSKHYIGSALPLAELPCEDMKGKHPDGYKQHHCARCGSYKLGHMMRLRRKTGAVYTYCNKCVKRTGPRLVLVEVCAD